MNDGESVTAIPGIYPTLTIANHHDVTLSAYGVQCPGLILSNCTNVTVEGITSTEYAGPAVWISGGSGCRILNSDLSKANFGVLLSGQNHTVQGNHIHDTYQTPPYPGPAQFVDADGVVLTGSGHQVLDNLIERIGLEHSTNPHRDGVQLLDQGASDILIARNRIFMAAPGPGNSGVMCSGKARAQNVVIEDNIIYSYVGVNTAAGVDGLIVRYNLFAGRGDPENAGSPPAPFAWFDVTDGLLEENIFYQWTSPVRFWSGPFPTMQGDLIWQTAPGDLKNYVEKDPQLDENYRYLAGRPGAGPRG